MPRCIDITSPKLLTSYLTRLAMTRFKAHGPQNDTVRNVWRVPVFDQFSRLVVAVRRRVASRPTTEPPHAHINAQPALRSPMGAAMDSK